MDGLGAELVERLILFSLILDKIGRFVVIKRGLSCVEREREYQCAAE